MYIYIYIPNSQSCKHQVATVPIRPPIRHERAVHLPEATLARGRHSPTSPAIRLLTGLRKDTLAELFFVEALLLVAFSY